MSLRVGGRFKNVKKGVPFTIMVVGASGLGRSSFVNTLCDKPVNPPKEFQKVKPASDNVDEAEPLELITKQVDLDEDGVRINLTIVDTPGFGNNIDNSKCFDKILNYIEVQYDQILAEETRIKRNPRFQDNRIHALLYFISPTGHGLRELDIELMKRLGSRVNIIPVIGKADSFSTDELKDFKARIMEDISYHRIPIYNFPYDSNEDDQEIIEECEELKSLLPFAVISHDEVLNPGKNPQRVRKYPWGVIDVDNPDFCDTARLRFMLFNSHMSDLKMLTDDILYENYRTEKLSRTGEYDDSEVLTSEESVRLKEEQIRLAEERLREQENKFKREMEEKQRELMAKEESLRQVESRGTESPN